MVRDGPKPSSSRDVAEAAASSNEGVFEDAKANQAGPRVDG